METEETVESSRHGAKRYLGLLYGEATGGLAGSNVAEGAAEPTRAERQRAQARLR